MCGVVDHVRKKQKRVWRSEAPAEEALDTGAREWVLSPYRVRFRKWLDVTCSKTD